MRRVGGQESRRVEGQTRRSVRRLCRRGMSLNEVGRRPGKLAAYSASDKFACGVRKRGISVRSLLHNVLMVTERSFDAAQHVQLRAVFRQIARCASRRRERERLGVHSQRERWDGEGSGRSLVCAWVVSGLGLR